MDKPFGWAFLGAGGIAHSVAKRILGSGRHRLVSVYNRTGARAEELAARYGATACESIEKAVSADGVEGVYVNVTNNVHYDIALRALKCKKAVLLEKPVTTTRAQLAALIDAAKENDVYFCEAMWSWFTDQAAQLKKIVDGGELGQVKRARISLCLPIAFSGKNRLLRPELAGGALLDLGIYPVTYAYRLFGMPKEIESRASFKCGVDVAADVIFKYDGFDVLVQAGIRSLRGVGESLEIVCERGKITSGAYHTGAKFKVRGEIKADCPKDKNAMLTQFDRVAGEIRGGAKESAFVPLACSLDTMEILDTVRGQIGLKFPFETE